MGKRKSKAAKQKQAKAAARGRRSSGSNSSSAAFGISVQRGARGRRRDAQTNAPTLPVVAMGRKSLGKSLNGSAAAAAAAAPKDSSKGRKSGGGGRGAKHKFWSRKLARGLAADAVGKADANKPRPGSPGDEHAEFDRQYESMAERAYRCGESGGSSGGGGSKRSSAAGGGAPAAAAVRLAPATLSLAPPTAEQLVAEAAEGIAGGMGEIGSGAGGGAAAPPPPTTNVPPPATNNLLQIMAAKKREEWAREEVQRQRELARGPLAAVGRNNPFAVLHAEDSDDEEEAGEKAAAASAVPRFNFAPASFSFAAAPSQCAEDDPDL